MPQKSIPILFELQNIINHHQFCAPTKLQVIGNGSSNGINTTYFNRDQISETQQQNLKKELGISDQDFVFIFVGRLVTDKGINELVSAFESLASTSFSNRKNPQEEEIVNSDKEEISEKNIKLLLVGPLEAKLDALLPETLMKMEKNQAILKVGYQGDVRPYFAIADALVFPSYREGFPNVVLQAGAMELPAIVTDINGCNEIVSDHHNGLLVPVKNDTALRDAMHLICTDTALYETLKKSTRESIAPYEQALVWEALLEEYRGVE